ncbi:MAG TPA: Gfo/Idh/MocA family oxidoreductase [Candidatus Hydrogenedentes bacterium]|nr:Gfo/Idh/MocA family oxidoreductase [Candidatus Hydrogenedentota bacterium]
MKIGIVDIDTSHPQNWLPIERNMGHEIIGLWDGGSVHPPQYVRKFAMDHSIPRIFPSLEEMAAQVDCAIIHSCDWDTHVDKAGPFIEAGKAVLIDKPMAGRLSHINQIKAWVRGGARIAGGSSLRFCYETRDWLAQPESERGVPHTVFCGCGVDEFNYGIHAYAMLSGILGPGIARVKHLGAGVQQRIEVTWNSGAEGFLVIGKAGNWLPFYASIVTERSITQYQADSGRLYQALLEATLPYLAGETDTAPVSIEALVEPELCALAARRSSLNGGSDVTFAGLTDDDAYHGQAFAQEYRKARYPG